MVEFQHLVVSVIMDILKIKEFVSNVILNVKLVKHIQNVYLVNLIESDNIVIVIVDITIMIQIHFVQVITFLNLINFLLRMLK